MSVLPTLVFVHLGSELPAWLGDAVRQVRLFNRCRVIVAAEASALAQSALPVDLGIERSPLEDMTMSESYRAFREISPLDRDFRDGFWTRTTERFFVLESLMAQLSLSHMVHLENDVMLYCDLEPLTPKLASLYPGIAAPFDNDQRCVPDFCYVPDLASIARLNAFLVAQFQHIRSHGLNADAAVLNDMTLLGQYRAHGPFAIDHLPIVPPDYPRALSSSAGHVVSDPSCYSRHFAALRMIFDAAALGQYLGGVDVRIVADAADGFVNESCVFDARELKIRLSADGEGRRIPIVQTPSGMWPVANLHIHSKNLRRFLSVGAS